MLSISVTNCVISVAIAFRSAELLLGRPSDRLLLDKNPAITTYIPAFIRIFPDRLREYAGKVPGTMEELVALPGLGRKSAVIILGNVFDKKEEGIAVDTHNRKMKRIKKIFEVIQRSEIAVSSLTECIFQVL